MIKSSHEKKINLEKRKTSVHIFILVRTIVRQIGANATKNQFVYMQRKIHF